MDRKTTRQVGNARPQQYGTLPQIATTGAAGGNTTAAPSPSRPGPYTTSAPRSPQQQAPATEAEKADMRQRLTTFLHQTDTDAGHATYRCQLAQWTAGRNSGDSITRGTPVPLRPGTAAVCTGECYRCGTHGHIGIQCPVPSGSANRLTPEESRWRAICTAVLGQANRLTGIQVHLVDMEMEVWQEWDGGAQHTESGNGEGSTA
jgi:hypothetical protein